MSNTILFPDNSLTIDSMVFSENPQLVTTNADEEIDFIFHSVPSHDSIFSETDASNFSMEDIMVEQPIDSNLHTCEYILTCLFFVHKRQSKVNGRYIQGPNKFDYPTLAIHIPSDYRHLKWFLNIYLLTEYHNGTYFMHPSKGFLGEHCDRNTPLDNPCKILLSNEDIRNGSFKLKLRIINKLGLPELKKQPLVEFCFVQAANKNDSTTPYSKNYHLGCVLANETFEFINTLCISNMMSESTTKNELTVEIHSPNESSVHAKPISSLYIREQGKT
ncbi:unnamed protein product, partial [Didymodactylos carnosus]